MHHPPGSESGGFTGRAAAARPGVLWALTLAAVLGWAPPLQAQQLPAVTVVVDTVMTEPFSQTFPVIGRLVPRRAGIIAARIGGPVAELRVDVGDRVNKGDVIAVLVTDTLKSRHQLSQAEEKQAAAALATARVETRLKRQELKRLENLRKSAAFSQARYDDKRQEVAMAKSSAAEAEASLGRYRANRRLAEIELRDAEIRAPYDGVVTLRHTEVGAYLKAGDSVVSMLDDHSMEIEADVPAMRIGALLPGTAVSYNLDGRTELWAAVRAVVPHENALTRTRTVRFTPQFVNGVPNLAANQSVNLRLPLGQARHVVTVHKDAVLNRMGRTIVYVVEDGAAQLRPVRLGEAVGGRFEVVRGLKAGEKVVVRGNERLRPGQPVAIKGAS